MSAVFVDLSPPSTAYVVDGLTKIGCEVTPCGSRVTCNPPPVGTDADYLVACADDDNAVRAVINTLSGAGFQWEGSEHYQHTARSGFMSWRRGEDNFIVIADTSLVQRHKAATALCRRLNLLDKADRIAAFRAILYNEMAP